MPVHWNRRCSYCGTRFPAAAARCIGCGMHLSRHERDCRSTRISGAVLPQVFISTRDFGRLEILARIQLETAHPVAELLLQELERATVCSRETVGCDIVTMNSRVVYKSNTDNYPQSATIVYPEDYQPTGQYISVMGPLGAALLGLRVGDSMPFTNLQGIPFSVTVKEVSFQPPL